jgi:hypothetical protein
MGDLTIQAGGRYELIGTHAGNIYVYGVAELPGVVTGNVNVYPGGRALISGRMFGNATNEGGQRCTTPSRRVSRAS